MSEKVNIKRRKLCAGDLRHKIELQERSIQAPLNGSPNFTEDFKRLNSVWSALETPRGMTEFDSVGTEEVVTHIFWIRFLEGVTTETWILFKGKRFNIILATNLEEQDEWLELKSTSRGKAELEASHV